MKIQMEIFFDNFHLNFSAKNEFENSNEKYFGYFSNIALYLEMMFPLSKMDLLGHHMFDKGR